MTIDSREDMASEVTTRIPADVVERERSAMEWRGSLHLVHWLAVVLSVVLTVALWQYAKHQIALRTEVRFSAAADDLAKLIEERLEKYELALWAGVSAIHTHGGNVDLIDWRNFAKNLDIEHRYPGINGIGVIDEVTLSELPSYLEQQRETRPYFNVHPRREDDIYQPITFIEPEDINIEAVGLDMMHEANRRTALGRARDTASTQITGPIILVQDESRTPGFLFFAPFYRGGDQETVENRIASFSGAVYAPFVVKRLMEGVLDKDRRTTTVRITDGEQVIYDEISDQDTDYDSEALGEKRILLSLYGREWALDVRAGLEFRGENTGFEAVVILIAGITLDVALLALFVLLSRANRRGLQFADMATNALEVANRDLEMARKEAESASDSKSVFLSTMSHEVRTPLTAISGIMELLERAGLPAKQARLVETGKKASDNLIKLLTDVLDVSRLEANAVDLWEREVAIRPLINEWQRLAEGMVEQVNKNIVVRIAIEDDMPKAIHVDDIRLSQIISNLVDNATRFTQKGGIIIRAFCRPADAEGKQRIGFSVSDSGKGIAESDLNMIFERFSQVDASMTRETSGAGLGLSICNDLIKLMGGSITVSSVVGAGTTFEIDLPADGVLSTGENLA